MNLFFFLFASITVLSAIAVISSRNPGHSVLYLIIAFVMFLVIKAYNHFEEMVDDEDNEEVVATESKEVTLLKEIRDGINNLQTK